MMCFDSESLTDVLNDVDALSESDTDVLNDVLALPDTEVLNDVLAILNRSMMCSTTLMHFLSQILTYLVMCWRF